jgi:hypothetical protein
MLNRNVIIKAGIAVTLAYAITVFAQAPVVNIGSKHPHLRAAEQSIVQAYQSIDQAQHDNQDQLGDHAQKAKDLLMQADRELKLAAGVSNAEGR